MINNLTVLKFENNYLFKSEINCLKYFFNIFSTEREDVLKLNYYVPNQKNVLELIYIII